MSHINIEVKARCPDPGRARSFLKSENARFRGTDHQIDTYFNVSHGRLKLREGTIENHLIFYERNDQKGPKQSDVSLLDIEPGSRIKDMLTKALGVLVSVDKSREIYFIGNVKFHIDEVIGLGTFVEIEAIDTGGIPKAKLEEQCARYMGGLGVTDSDLVPGSYSDLLLEKKVT